MTPLFFLPFFWGLRVLLINYMHNSLLYFVYGTTFCLNQKNNLTWKKMIPCVFIQNCFKCDYDHCSTVAFGNAQVTL